MLHVTSLLNGWVSRAPVIHKGNLITSYFSRHHSLPPWLIMHDVARTNSWNVQRAVNMRTGFGEVITFSRVCFGILFKFCPIRNYRRELGSRCDHVRCISIVKPTTCTSVSSSFYFGMTLCMFRTYLSFHHQEFKTVHTAIGICQTDTALCLLAGTR